MLALSDRELSIIMAAAFGLPVEKRAVFLERVAARAARSAMPISTRRCVRR